MLLSTYFVRHRYVAKTSILKHIQVAIAWLTIIQIISRLELGPPLIIYSTTSPITNQNPRPINISNLTVNNHKQYQNHGGHSVLNDGPMPGSQYPNNVPPQNELSQPVGQPLKSSHYDKQPEVQSHNRNDVYGMRNPSQLNFSSSHVNHDQDTLYETGSGQGPTGNKPVNQSKKHSEKVVDDTEEGDDEDEDEEDDDYKDTLDVGSGDMPTNAAKKKPNESIKNQFNPARDRFPTDSYPDQMHREPSPSTRPTQLPAITMIAPPVPSIPSTKYSSMTTSHPKSENSTKLPVTTQNPMPNLGLINNIASSPDVKPHGAQTPIKHETLYNTTNLPDVEVPYGEMINHVSSRPQSNREQNNPFAYSRSPFLPENQNRIPTLVNGSLITTPARDRHPSINNSSLFRPNNASKTENDDYDYEDSSDDDDSADLSNFEDGEPAESEKCGFEGCNTQSTPSTSVSPKPQTTANPIFPQTTPTGLNTNLHNQLKSPIAPHNISMHKNSTTVIDEGDEDDDDEDEDDEDLESDDDSDTDDLNSPRLPGMAIHSTTSHPVFMPPPTPNNPEHPMKPLVTHHDHHDDKYRYSTTIPSPVTSLFRELPSTSRPKIEAQTTTSSPAITNAATFWPSPSTNSVRYNAIETATSSVDMNTISTTTVTTATAAKPSTSIVPITISTASTTTIETTTTTTTATTTTTPRPDYSRPTARVPIFSGVFPSTTTKRPNHGIIYATTIKSKAPPMQTKTSNILTYDRSLQDDSDGLTKQFVDKAIEVYTATNKAIQAAIEAVWPPKIDSSSFEPLLDKPFLFMLAMGSAVMGIVLTMMLVVYIISSVTYQMPSKEEDDDLSMY